jgi:hypothetical protein
MHHYCTGNIHLAYKCTRWIFLIKNKLSSNKGNKRNENNNKWGIEKPQRGERCCLKAPQTNIKIKCITIKGIKSFKSQLHLELQ